MAYINIERYTSVNPENEAPRYIHLVKCIGFSMVYINLSMHVAFLDCRTICIGFSLLSTTDIRGIVLSTSVNPEDEAPAYIYRS